MRGWTLALLAATLGGCMSTEVVWQSATGVTVKRNTLTKTAADGWSNAGASSVQQLWAGDGYVEVDATVGRTQFGLSYGDTDLGPDDIDFGLRLLQAGTLRVYENATDRGLVGTYGLGDKLTVGVEGGVVKYRKNGTLLYTSAVTPTYPLLVDAALYHQGAAVTNAKISAPARCPVRWTLPVSVDVSGNLITRTIPTGAGSSGAVSVEHLDSGDGYVEVVVDDVTGLVTGGLGLLNGPFGYDNASLDYGLAFLLVAGTPTVYVLESGASKYSGERKAGDRFAISIEGGTVQYRQNGTIIYTSLTSPSYPLHVGAYLTYEGAYFRPWISGMHETRPHELEADLGEWGWSRLTEDLLTNPKPNLTYGISGTGPLDLVASAGRLSFSLNNSEENSAGLLGYYSPQHANCRDGFGLGIAIRYIFQAAGFTPSGSPSPSPSESPSASVSASPSPSYSPSYSPSASPSPSYSPSRSPSSSPSPSVSESASYSASRSPSASSSASISPSMSESGSPSASISPSISPSSSPSASASGSPSSSYSPSRSPSASPSPSYSPSASVSVSPSPSYSPSASVSVSPSPSYSPSRSPSASESPSYSPSASESPSASPSEEAPGTAIVKFIGILKSIDPDAGLYGTRKVNCSAIDWMDEAASARVNVATQIDQRADEVLSTLIAAIDRQPPLGTSFQVANSTFPYAFDNSRSDAISAMTEIQRICQSEFGRCYLRNGVLHFEKRTGRIAPLSEATFDGTMQDLSVPSDISKVRNKAKVTVHPKTVDATDTVVLFSKPETSNPEIGAGETITITGRYNDPANRAQRVGGMDMQDPVATTDYLLNAQEDGSGADLTADCSVSVVYGANQAEYEITNIGGTLGYLTKLQARGRGLYDYDPIDAVSSDDTSIAEIGENLVTLDMPYQTDTGIAGAVADFLVAIWSSTEPGEASMRFIPRTEDELEMAMRLEPGDAISVIEEVTGTSGAFFIQRVHISVGTSIGDTDFEFSLQRALVESFWLLGTAGSSELGVTTVVGPL